MAGERLDRRDLAIACLLVALILAAYWSLLTPDVGRRRSFPPGDFYDQFHAFASYEHDRLWAGQIPLWNPYTFGGHPFLADIQAAVFYPLSMLFLLLSGPGTLSPFWLEIEAILHLMLAALFTYAFVRRRLVQYVGDAGRGGALIAALTFSFGGYLTSYPPLQMAILETQVWLPLLLLLLDVGITRQRWPHLLGAGAVWGVALLAGHPQSAMYVGYGALAYGLFRARQEHRSLRWSALAQLVWIGVGIGLAAVHLLPGLEFMGLSVRSEAAYEELAGGFSLRELAQYIVPGAITRWSPMYVGIPGLYLAAAACWAWIAGRWPRSRVNRSPDEVARPGRLGAKARAEIGFWAVLALVSVVLSLGGRAILYRLFYWVVPGFNLFRSQERAIYLSSFALAVLSAYGWTWLRSPGNRLPGSAQVSGPARVAMTGMFALSMLALLLTVGAWGLGRWQAGFSPDELWRRLLRWAVLSWCTWVAVGWLFSADRWFAALAAALVLADLWTASARTNLEPGLVQERVYDGVWLASALTDERDFRIANEWGLPGNAGCLLRAEDLYGASPLRLQAHKTMSDALPHWRLWQLFGVRYVITWEHDLPGPLAAERVAMQGPEWVKNTVYVHRLREEFPLAWVASQARHVDDEQALGLLAASEFDPFEEALLAEPAPAGFELARQGEQGSVKVVRRQPEETVVRAELPAAGWLVFGEWYYPGRQATVDGVRQSLYRVDYALCALPLGPGQHVVQLRYRPISLYLGAGVSAVTLLLLLVAGVREVTRGCRARRRRV